MDSERDAESLTRSPSRLAQEAALGMAIGVDALDVHHDGEGMVPHLVEHERVGNGNAKTAGQEEDGKHGGADSAGHERHDGNLPGSVSAHNSGERRKGLAGAGRWRRFNVDTG